MIIFCGNVSVSQTRYVDAVFKDVSSKTYIYAIKNVDTLKLDLYQPVDDRLKKRPLFVIIHGGGFTTGTRTDASLISLANGIAKKGFVVASVDYRLLPKQKSFNCNIPVQEALQIYSKAQGDVLEAILYALNDTFKTDASKIILFGTSAGAETALNIAYNKSAVKHRSKRIKNISIAGLISVSGALVNSNLITQTNAVPGAFYHGKKDTMLPYYQGAHHSCSILNSGYFLMDGSKKIVERLENLEASFLFYGYKNKGHDIFNLPSKDFKDAFLFLKRVVFDGTFYQKKVIQ
jgi:poly(3-hydroxybutyrate) depolymerase